MAERARAIVRAGVPVMGHVGLTPQTATALGGYRAQGRTAERAKAVLEDALALQEAGCFAIVFEAIPAEVTDVLMELHGDPGDRDRRGREHGRPGARAARPARASTSGFKPKFVKQYADDRRGDGPRRHGLRGGGPQPRVPRAGAHLRDRPGGARAARRPRCARRAATGRRPRCPAGFHTLAPPWPASPSCSRRESASSSTCSRKPVPTSSAPRSCSSACSTTGPTTASSRVTSWSASRRATASRTTSSSG